MRQTDWRDKPLDHTLAVHFIGIGGAGMSGIAKVLLEMGVAVTGSDLKASRYTEALTVLGAQVAIGHAPDNVAEPDVVVISSAIPASNPELRRARAANIPVVARAEMLAHVCRAKRLVAVAGTHGKTTTTSMIAFMLEELGADPMFLIGGELNDIGSNAKYGAGAFGVVEADESDGSLMRLSPEFAVITNVDNDHLDYHGSFEAVIDLFGRWLDKLPPDGRAIVLGDGSAIDRVAAGSGKPYLTFGFERDNDLAAAGCQFDRFGSRFEVWADGRKLGRVSLRVPGGHNVLNALAALSFGRSVGLDFKAMAEVLARFTGVQRRFQLLGTKRNVGIVDDYAHHPSEVKATLDAARLGGWRRVVCVFQPHRYTRTKFLHDEFGRAFSCANIVVVTDVYGAGEEPIPGVTGKLLVDSILDANPRQRVIYLPKKADISNYLLRAVQPGDLVVTMGAGDIWTVGSQLLDHLIDVDEVAEPTSESKVGEPGL